MPRSEEICVVCHRLRTNGSHDEAGEIFICVDCQADAKEFLDIQDAIWGPDNDRRSETDE